MHEKERDRIQRVITLHLGEITESEFTSKKGYKPINELAGGNVRIDDTTVLNLYAAFR